MGDHKRRARTPTVTARTVRNRDEPVSGRSRAPPRDCLVVPPWEAPSGAASCSTSFASESAPASNALPRCVDPELTPGMRGETYGPTTV
jgi:hypothetical protein